MRYRMIVWDFDGTLANTLALALATYNELAARHGFRPVDDPAAIRSLGMKAFLRQHGISLVRLPFLLNEYLAVTRNRMDTIQVFEGVPELLTTLKARGCRLGVLSSNSAENVQTCLRANGLENLFEFVVGYPRLFGKAKAIRRLLKREAVTQQEFLYVGDEVRDVEAAKRAGVDVGAVTWGLNSPEQLARESPTYLWASPAEVWPALAGSVE